MFFAVANTFANTFYMQTNGFGKLHWYLNHSHSCGLNRVIRVYHYPVLQVMAERLFRTVAPDHCMNRYLPDWKSHGVQSLMAHCKHKRICLHYSVVKELLGSCQPVSICFVK